MSDFEKPEGFIRIQRYERADGTLSRGKPYAFFSDRQGSALVSIDNEGAVYLKHLAGTFPKEFASALGKLGYRMQRDMKKFIREGNIAGKSIRGSENSARIRRMESYHNDGEKTFNHKRYKRGKHAGQLRWSENRSKPRKAYRGWGQSISYLNDRRNLQLKVGYAGYTARSTAEMMIEGRRGTKGRYQYLGPQPVTPRMRRFFAATGRPLKFSTKTIDTPARPLFVPALEHFKPQINPFIEERVTRILKDKK